MNIPEALGFTFTYKGNSKKGIDLADKTLEWFAKSGTDAEKVAAAYLLEHTVESNKDGKFSGRIKKPVAAPTKPATPPPPEPPPAAPEPDAWQQFAAQEDDGFDPVGVSALATHMETPRRVMPKAVVPMAKPLPAEVPEWAKELFQRLEVVGMKADLAADASTSVLERMTEIATTLKKWASSETPAPAAGVGQSGANGGGQFTTEKIETLKNKGRLSFKVKGGRFQKFGVTMWPEVFEDAGFKLSDFPVGEEIDFRGHTAIFTNAPENEDGKIYPDKIIKLVKAK